MENREDCKKVIEVLDKAKLQGNTESITVKFADSGSSRRKLSESHCLVACASSNVSVCVCLQIDGKNMR